MQCCSLPFLPRLLRAAAHAAQRNYRMPRARGTSVESRDRRSAGCVRCRVKTPCRPPAGGRDAPRQLTWTQRKRCNFLIDMTARQVQQSASSCGQVRSGEETLRGRTRRRCLLLIHHLEPPCPSVTPLRQPRQVLTAASIKPLLKPLLQLL